MEKCKSMPGIEISKFMELFLLKTCDNLQIYKSVHTYDYEIYQFKLLDLIGCFILVQVSTM